MSVAKRSKKKVIVWAVDPTQKIQKEDAIIQELKIWSKKLNCAVQPVVVASGSVLAGIQQSDEDIIEHLAKVLPKEFLKAQVLIVATISNRQMATALARATLAKNAAMIFANTRAKKTWNPFRLGGFAETLITKATVPVLLMNQAAKASIKVSSILYPTDFTLESKHALKELQPIAKSFGSEVTIFNQLDWATYYYSQMGTGWPGVDLTPIAEEARQSRQKKVEQWSADLKKQGLRTQGLVHKQRKTLAEDIVEFAGKNKSGLIAMASRGGVVEQAILGSAVRDVIALAKCPVLIFPQTALVSKRSRPEKQIKKEKAIFKNGTSSSVVLHS